MGGGIVKGSMRMSVGVPGVVLLALSLPIPAIGQALELGGGFAQVRNPPPELFESICPASRSWAGDGRIGLRFSRAFSLEGQVTHNFETGDQCVAEPEVPPDTGPFERVTRETGAGFPYWTTDARLNFEPSSPSGNIWLKAFAGYGRIWDFDTGYWLVGGGIVFAAAIESVIEFEWNWIDVPFTETTEEFLNGALVSEETLTGHTSHSTLRIRAGFRLRP
jgi:hypothetical protein